MSFRRGFWQAKKQKPGMSFFLFIFKVSSHEKVLAFSLLMIAFASVVQAQKNKGKPNRQANSRQQFVRPQSGEPGTIDQYPR